MPNNSLPTDDALGLAVTMFITAKEAQRVSPRTLEAYQRALAKFTTWLRAQKITTPHGVTPHIVRSYFAELGKGDLTAWSVHDYARVVKTWLRFLFADGIIPTDVMAKVTMPRLDKRILPAFTPEEVRALLDACEDAQDPERDTALVLLMLDSGLRAAEVCALTVGDVDTRTGAVTVQHGKGGKDRTAYIGARTRRAMLRYLYTRAAAGAGEPLFPSHHGADKLTPNGLLQFCHRLGKRADVPSCHPHKFRRTAALESLRAGMDLLRLAAMMGHEDLKTLRGYLELVKADLRAAHTAHGAVDRLLGDKKGGC